MRVTGSFFALLPLFLAAVPAAEAQTPVFLNINPSWSPDGFWVAALTM